jgi:hypothetical protein
MKKGLLGILAVGLMTTAANAAGLSLRFAGGATEITMTGASDSATIEVLLTFSANGFDNSTKNPSKISSINARFDVGDLAPGVGGQYIDDDFGDTDAGKWVVTSTDVGVDSPAAWNTLGSSPNGTNFDQGYFFASEDPTGAAVISGNPARTVVLGSFTIHKTNPSPPFPGEDTFISFHVEDPLPALSEGPASWGSRWQYTNQVARNQYLLNEGGTSLPGNPGDADPRWASHGFETLNPLIIHNVPEPSALALLALGGLAMLRRRN